MIKSFIYSAATGLALMASSAIAQQPPGANNSWTVPAGAQVTLNKTTGAVSILMPREIADRASGSARFDAWRTTPYAGTGPFPAARVEETSLPTHTLYYPADLKKATPKGVKLPVVLWANGGCRNTSIEFTAFLGELASRGYFIVANGRNDVAFSVAMGGPALQSQEGKPPLQVRGGAPVIQGLDWLTTEAANKKSKYYNKVDLTKVAALGQSCGGGQVWEASKDNRIKAVAALNSSFPTKTQTFAGAPGASDGHTVETINIPAAFFVGGPGDLAFGNAQTAFRSAPSTVPFVNANMPEMGHTGAYREPQADWANVVTAWLDWQLKGDEKGKAMFAGADCGLCKNPAWWYESKGIN